MLCGSAPYTPRTRGLFAHRLDVMDNDGRSLFVVDLANPKSKPQLVARKIYGNASVAVFSPAPRVRSLDSLASSDQEN
jgi:hypothetical protein